MGILPGSPRMLRCRHQLQQGRENQGRLKEDARVAQTPAPSHAWIGRVSTWRTYSFPGPSLRRATLHAEQANPNTVSERPVAAAEVTYGELVKGDSGGVFAQSIRDCQSHLVLHCREELEVSDVTPVFGKDILLADHLSRAVSGKQG